MKRTFIRTSISFLILFSIFAQSCSAAILYGQGGAETDSAYYADSTGTDTEKPSAPTALTAISRTHTSISISWKDSRDNVGVKGYQVFRDGRKIITVAKTDYTNKGLIPGQEYVFTVKAYDAAGNLSESSSALRCGTLQDKVLPTAPSGLSAVTAAYTSITLKWDPSSDNIGIRGYDIYCNDAKKGSESIEYYVCKGLEPGKNYTFYVKARDIAGNFSGNSNKVQFSTLSDNSAPSVPEGLKAVTATETEINLAWSPSTDNLKVKGYEIYMDGVKKSKISKPEYTCKGLIPGKSYEFRIKALDSTGNSSALSKPLKTATVSDTKAPAAPANLKVKSVKGSSVALEWIASTDNVKVKGYRIYCNGLEIETATRPSRSVKVPKGIGINILWVKAYDVTGNLSPASKSVTIIG